MKIIVSGGTGFIGKYLVNCYLEQQHEVTVIGRSRAKINKTFSNKVHAIDWNTLRQTGIEALKNKDLIINLAGEGIATHKWTNKRKQEIINSRVKPTELLATLCAKLGPAAPPLFNASAIGLYGTQPPTPEGLPPRLTEKSALSHKHQFSQTVVKRWEAATTPAQQASCRVVLMRFGVVLGKQGGALARLKRPFSLGVGGKLGSGQQPFSWIALPDLKRAIDFLLDHAEIQGPVNFTSPNCVTQQELAKTLGKTLGRPTFLSTPAFILRSLYGQMAEELLLGGQAVYPEVLLTHGFHFEFEDLARALAYALK